MNDRKQQSLLVCDDLVKQFNGTTAVDDVSFSLYRGELLAILGPSGCGKSTLLRMIAGLVEPNGGTLCYEDQIWADGDIFIKPEERDCGMVFQDMALFPHLTIGDNIGFAIPAGQKASVVEEMLALVDLEGMERRMPHQLSGGQQQRVALARSLAPGPGLLLLDEPFSSLDLRLRQSMRKEVRRILKKKGVAAILVTHDQNEAFSFADRVAMMFEGKIEQHGSPQELYKKPATQNTASFVGDANFIAIERGIALFPWLQKLDQSLKEPGNILMCRPENFILTREGDNAEITGVDFQGPCQEVTLRLDCEKGEEHIIVQTDTETLWSEGQKVMVLPFYSCIYSLDGRLRGTVRLLED